MLNAQTGMQGWRSTGGKKRKGMTSKPCTQRISLMTHLQHAAMFSIPCLVLLQAPSLLKAHNETSVNATQGIRAGVHLQVCGR